jgi:uncharacterized delta-60 repeat protein
MKKPFFAILLAFLSFARIPDAKAQPFIADTTFNLCGIDTVLGSYALGIVHRPSFVLPQKDNQKIVLAGYSQNSSTVEVMRLHYDGGLDTTFNGTGIARVTIPYTNEVPSAAMLFDTSRVIVLATKLGAVGGYDISVYNFKANGQLDSAFGINGVANVGLSGTPVYSRPIDCAVQSDKKFVVLGKTKDPATGMTICALTRLLTNGAVDLTYGLDGIASWQYPKLNVATTTSGTTAGLPVAGFMQADNKYVIAGTFCDSVGMYGGSDVFAVRHKASGDRDLTFGDTSGMAIVKVPGQRFSAASMGADAGGNYYILAEFARNFAPFCDTNYVVIKLDHNGQRVPEYGSNGIAYLRLQISGIAANGFAVQPNGRVVIAGTLRSGVPVPGNKVVVYRMDASGNPDTGFNAAGMITLQRAGKIKDVFTGTAIQPDGRVLVTGWDSVSATAICTRFANYVLPPLFSIATEHGFSGFSIRCYPNPLESGSLQIEYSNSEPTNTGTVTVCDMTGRMQYSRSFQLNSGGGVFSLDLPAALASGTYVIVVQNSMGERKVQPLVLKR